MDARSTEIDVAVLKGEFLAHSAANGILFRALITSHPDPNALAKHFDAAASITDGTILKEVLGEPVYSRMMELLADHRAEVAENASFCAST